MKFNKGIAKKYRQSIEDAFATILDRGNNFHRHMAQTILEEWGVRSCEDFGELVFNMVEHSILAKTEQDRREDFKSGYDFYDAFRKPFLPVSRLEASEKPAELKNGCVWSMP